MDEKRICYNCFRELTGSETRCGHCGYDPADDEGRFPMALPTARSLPENTSRGASWGRAASASRMSRRITSRSSSWR